jgi:hypothetical protein
VQQVVEQQCRQIPDKECSVQIINTPRTVNTTECKESLNTQCANVQQTVNEKVCSQTTERVCKKVPSQVRDTVPVSHHLCSCLKKYKFKNA